MMQKINQLNGTMSQEKEKVQKLEGVYGRATCGNQLSTEFRVMFSLNSINSLIWILSDVSME